VVAALAAAQVAAVSAAPSAGEPAAPRNELAIWFTANVRGDWEPCSCPDEPLGGVAQLAAIVGESDPPALWLDAGDRFFAHSLAVPDSEDAVRKLGALLLADAGAAAGLDAQGIGRLDLAAGALWLRKLAERVPYPLLSANLVDDAGAPLFRTRALLPLGGPGAPANSPVLGVTSVLPADVEGRGFHAVDPVAAARSEVRALRAGGAALVVLLSNLGADADRALARAARADAVLSSSSRTLTIPEPGPRRGPVLAEPGARGRHVGLLRWDPATGLSAELRPVPAGGPVHPRVAALVQATQGRLLDPTLGMPPEPAPAAGGSGSR
jgi:2',3'-cyclic-nucleotide 2'-phosphodiesterase (5'-nucleotidase family)